jgi:prolyl-tRNA synthetase
VRLSGKKKLPLLIYQVGNKYRDELRPKNGLMRAKEFLMKDMYSFDETVENAFITYDQVVQAYKNIFTAWGLDHVMVDADTGNIGGTRSHEFQVLADAGEDTVLLCDCPPATRYAANVEKACGAPVEIKTDDPFSFAKYQQVTVAKDTLANAITGASAVNLTVHMEAPEKNAKPQTATVIIGPNREVNVLKIKAKLGAYDVQVANTTEKKESTYTFIDTTAQSAVETALSNLSEDQGITVHIGDFRTAKKGDLCVHSSNAGCKCSPLRETSGIEIGHVFYLGQKYSKPFKIALSGSNFVEMGCYGIGVSRAMQSVVETNNDDEGVIWPMAIAPFRACVIPMRPAKSDTMVRHSLSTNLILVR